MSEFSGVSDDAVTDIDVFVEPHFSTYPESTHGPEPVPSWVVTDPNALDDELGILKTGKEADVHLLRRALPGTDGTLLAAKRYRPAERRMFHRDAGYTEGRRVRRSRETRAMARRTEFGRELLSGQWAAAEFDALSRLWSSGLPVPYPVQLSGTEVLMEFIGTEDGAAAPRLAQTRADADTLGDLYHQVVDAMRALAAHGWAHGDLSAFNLLVHDGRVVMIDLPQVVDVAANPQGADYLLRDCRNITEWFARRGLQTPEFDFLFGDLMATLFGA